MQTCQSGAQCAHFLDLDSHTVDPAVQLSHITLHTFNGAAYFYRAAVLAFQGHFTAADRGAAGLGDFFLVAVSVFFRSRRCFADADTVAGHRGRAAGVFSNLSVFVSYLIACAQRHTFFIRAEAAFLHRHIVFAVGRGLAGRHAGTACRGIIDGLGAFLTVSRGFLSRLCRSVHSTGLKVISHCIPVGISTAQMVVYGVSLVNSTSGYSYLITVYV